MGTKLYMSMINDAQISGSTVKTKRSIGNLLLTGKNQIYALQENQMMN